MSDSEMTTIKEVMFNMGMGLTDNFISLVSKEVSGKNFTSDLAQELE